MILIHESNFGRHFLNLYLCGALTERLFGTTRGVNPSSENDISLRSPSLIMAPDFHAQPMLRRW